jgi:hypothetical protein
MQFQGRKGCGMGAPNWRIFYKEILSEPNQHPPDYLEFLIHETEDAIFLRLQEVSDSADCASERSDMEAAMHRIRRASRNASFSRVETASLNFLFLSFITAIRVLPPLFPDVRYRTYSGFGALQRIGRPLQTKAVRAKMHPHCRRQSNHPDVHTFVF